MNSGGALHLQRACLETAFDLVQSFLGRSCPLGCSLSAPATGGFSMVSPQCSCMRQAPRRRSGPGAHFMEYHSTIVRILQGGAEASPEAGGRDGGWVGLLWPTPSYSGGSGLACAAIPPAPPSNVFRYRGTPPVPPAGAAPPAPCLGNGGGLPSQGKGPPS